MTKTTDQESPYHDVDATIHSNEKRNWLSPKIEVWESVNIELAGGVGADGGFATYF
ncbi:hypothetical protein AQBE111736_00260 [Aquirufa beregesia]|uniref:hypothetical protein n=1 Tax=Aquirufa beregesia TaxID=2516556 RepID=UPI0014085CFA|nr:hypothetical protein [Aquirufa beregesia]